MQVLGCFRTHVLAQVRTYPLVQKDKIFAIGYCFGGAAVLELMRAWPKTPGLLGEHSQCISPATFPLPRMQVATETSVPFPALMQQSKFYLLGKM